MMIEYQLETCPGCGRNRPLTIAVLDGVLVCGKCFDNPPEIVNDLLAWKKLREQQAKK